MLLFCSVQVKLRPNPFPSKFIFGSYGYYSVRIRTERPIPGEKCPCKYVKVRDLTHDFANNCSTKLCVVEPIIHAISKTFLPRILLTHCPARRFSKLSFSFEGIKSYAVLHMYFHCYDTFTNDLNRHLKLFSSSLVMK